MLSKNTVIVSSTYYGNDQESALRRELAEEAFDRASRLGYEIVVVDGSPDTGFRKTLEKMSHRMYVLEQKERGMGPSRRQAFAEAYKAADELEMAAIAWTEPEKVDYIDEIEKTAEPILSGRADMVVPRRMSMDSYPTAQQHAEKFGNDSFNILLSEYTGGQHFDVWFGPRTWHRDQSGLFIDYNPNLTARLIADRKGAGFRPFNSVFEIVDLWDAHHMPVAGALIQGRRVVPVDVDYTHPEAQTAFEEGNPERHRKMIQQLINLYLCFSVAEDYYRRGE